MLKIESPNTKIEPDESAQVYSVLYTFPSALIDFIDILPKQVGEDRFNAQKGDKKFRKECICHMT